jgi:hypothetical protein
MDSISSDTFFAVSSSKFQDVTQTAAVAGSPAANAHWSGFTVRHRPEQWFA